MNQKNLNTNNIYVCLAMIELYDDYGDVYNCLHIPKIYEKTGNFLELEGNIYESFYDIETGNIINVHDNSNVYIDSYEESMHLEEVIKLSTLIKEFDNISSKYKDITDVCFKGYSNVLKKKLNKKNVKRDELYALSKIIFTIHNYIYEFKNLLDEDFNLYETKIIDFNKYKRTR